MLDWTEKQVWISLLWLAVLTCQGLKVQIITIGHQCFLLIKSAIDFMKDYTRQHDNIKFLVWTGWVEGGGGGQSSAWCFHHCAETTFPTLTRKYSAKKRRLTPSETSPENLTTSVFQSILPWEITTSSLKISSPPLTPGLNTMDWSRIFGAMPSLIIWMVKSGRISRKMVC